MRKKRLAFLLSFILMCNSLMASMVPIRELATDQAAISYTKVNGVGIVTYKENGAELKLNVKTGIVTTSTGKVVNVPIKLENGITYVESNAFKEVVAKEQSNKDFLKNLLKQIYTALTTTLSATQKANNVTKVAEHSSSSSSSSTTSVAFQTTTTKPNVSNFRLTAWNDRNVFLTTGDSIKIDTTTSNALNITHDNLLFTAQIDILFYRSSDYKLYINNELQSVKRHYGFCISYGNLYLYYEVFGLDLKDGDVIRISADYGDYTFIYHAPYMDEVQKEDTSYDRFVDGTIDFEFYDYYKKLFDNK